MRLSPQRMMTVEIGTLRLLMDDANQREDYHRARMEEAITDQDLLSAEADRRGVLL